MRRLALLSPLLLAACGGGFLSNAPTTHVKQPAPIKLGAIAPQIIHPDGIVFPSGASLTTLGPGCIGTSCLLNYTNFSGNVPGTSSADEDDWSGLQTALNTAVQTPSAQGVLVIPPATRPSGYYDLCSSPLTFPTESPSSIRVDATRALIRVLPSCGSPSTTLANGLFYIPAAAAAAAGYPDSDYNRVIIDGAYLDGWGLAPYEIVSKRSRVTLNNITLRNSVGGANNANANIMLTGGGDVRFTGANYLGNFNDPGHTIYNSITDFPYYNYFNNGCASMSGGLCAGGAHDSFISNLQGINAQYANFEDTSGSGMAYLMQQGYGYTSSGTSPNNLGAPCFNWEVGDNAEMLVGGYFGGTALNAACPGGGTIDAGLHILHNTTTANHVFQVVGGWNVHTPTYQFLAEYNALANFGASNTGAQYTILDFDCRTYSVSCWGQYDTSGTIHTVYGSSWFAPVTAINMNTNSNNAAGSQAVSFGNVTVNGTLTANGSIIVGVCPSFTFTNSSTFTTAYGTTCATGAGTGTLTSSTLELPAGSPISGCTLPPAGTPFSIIVSPAVTTFNVEDHCGSTSDVVGGPFTLGGSRQVSGVVNAAGTAWVVGD